MATKNRLEILIAARKKRKENIAAARANPKPKGLSKQRLWQEKMVHESRCQRCGKPIDPKSLSSCKQCLKKARDRYRRKKGRPRNERDSPN